jgi:hypothetical protein
MNVGTWVVTKTGQTALITTWDIERGVAIAERPSTGKLERPIAVATQDWTEIPEDGLRVRAAMDPAGIRTEAQGSPVDLVVLALIDLGGRAGTSAIHQALTPLVIGDDEWEHWWKRAQIRLEDDPRIDATRSREKTYQLQGSRESSLGVSLHPAKRREQRGDRFLADGPQLKRARDRARRPGPFSSDDERLFRLEASLAEDASVNPTDRFMAAELGVWVKRWNWDEAMALLGVDLLGIDLLRIPQHESRTRALQAGLSLLKTAERDDHEPVSVSILRSAFATGSPWSDQVRECAVAEGIPLAGATYGTLGWAVPGDEDSGQAKYPDDLNAFERRIERAEALQGALEGDELVGLGDGAIRALSLLPDSGVHAYAVARARERLARLVWSILGRAPRLLETVFAQRDPIGPDGLAALIRAGSSTHARALRASVMRWFADDPPRYMSSLALLGSVTGEGALALGLESAQRELARTDVPGIAAQLLRYGNGPDQPASDFAAVVNLAVTTAGNDPSVAKAVERLAEAIATTYIEGTGHVEGPITFSRAAWERVSDAIERRLRDAAANEGRAQLEAAAATREAESLRLLAESRAAALAEARASAGGAERQDVGRLASNLLKPVALALGDSFESAHLAGLQDQLLAILQRARIRPILEIGQRARFEPLRHQWVGDGSPTAVVEARSPGFVSMGDGDNEIVLVPARVVAPRGST